MKDYDVDMTREELTDLVRKIYDPNMGDHEFGILLYKLKQYARNGKISDFIYYPKSGDPPNPTVEQVVEKAIELRNANPTVFLMPPPKSPSKARFTAGASNAKRWP